MGDIESVQKYAFLRNKGKFIDFVFGVERNFPRFITRRFHMSQLVVTGRHVERKISSGYVSECGWVRFQRYRLVKAPAKQSQHAEATYRNIVGRNMSRSFGHRVATCWMLLAQVWKWSNLSQQHPTCCKTSQHGGQTHTTCCAQKCCEISVALACCDRLAGA